MSEGEETSPRDEWSRGDRIVAGVLASAGVALAAFAVIRSLPDLVQAAIIGATLLGASSLLATFIWNTPRLWLLSLLLFGAAAAVAPFYTKQLVDLAALEALLLTLMFGLAVQYFKSRSRKTAQ